jgi:hypothetical protein
MFSPSYDERPLSGSDTGGLFFYPFTFFPSAEKARNNVDENRNR